MGGVRDPRRGRGPRVRSLDAALETLGWVEHASAALQQIAEVSASYARAVAARRRVPGRGRRLPAPRPCPSSTRRMARAVDTVKASVSDDPGQQARAGVLDRCAPRSARGARRRRGRAPPGRERRGHGREPRPGGEDPRRPRGHGGRGEPPALRARRPRPGRHGPDQGRRGRRDAGEPAHLARRLPAPAPRGRAAPALRGGAARERGLPRLHRREPARHGLRQARQRPALRAHQPRGRGAPRREARRHDRQERLRLLPAEQATFFQERDQSTLRERASSSTSPRSPSTPSSASGGSTRRRSPSATRAARPRSSSASRRTSPRSARWPRG